MTLDDAIVDAITMKRTIQGDNLDPVFAKMRDDLDRISDEMDVSTLLPGGPDAALGVAARRKNPKDFYTAFKARIKANLCAKDGEFSKLIKAGMQASVGAIVTALAAVLAVPAVALPLIVSIAVLISHSGLEAFCEI